MPDTQKVGRLLKDHGKSPLNELFLEDEWDQFSEVLGLILDDLLNREEQ